MRDLQLDSAEVLICSNARRNFASIRACVFRGASEDMKGILDIGRELVTSFFDESVFGDLHHRDQ